MDTDNPREHPTIKFVSALANHKNSRTPINPALKALVLTYQIKNYIIPLNDQKNPNYFIVGFLTLFLFRASGQKYGPRCV